MEDSVIASLSNGSAWFEYVESAHGIPVSASQSRSPTTKQRRPLFFARIGLGSVARQAPPAAKKVEHYTVQRVAGDGRCMFRALVLGMATNKGMRLGSNEEKQEETLCDSAKERKHYEEALIAITVDESLKLYCQRILKPDFWGGESELLVLSRMLSQPVVVYIPEAELKPWGSGFIPIAEYGSEFLKSTKEKKARLLYTGRNHYDLLI